MTIDHVVPISKGGRHEWDNVVAACGQCNNRKGNKMPDQVDMALLKRPQRPNWLPIREFDFNSGGLPSSWQVYLGALVAESS
ncbi:MAG: hypothetical protein A4S09_16845 [Proteobacteria bacterium SG_bin7]|nr:MAG: hypothetical protein A4S09_16845 [Proteobacteria bacterium SG_bin7]